MAETNVHVPEFVARRTSAAFEMPAEVRAFAGRHGIEDVVILAAELVERHFVLAAPLELSKIDDPDSHGEWIEIQAKVLGDVPAVQASHSNYTRDWLGSVPLDKSSLIRLALDLG